MNSYEFTMRFALPAGTSYQVAELENLLFEAGCDDAIVGVGTSGRIALTFSRGAPSASEAILSALQDVRTAIPNVRLIEASPDLVGISDVAELLGFSRQNMRKLVITHHNTFPLPIHEGSQSIWHLADVLQWFIDQQNNRDIQPSLLELANANMQLNFAREASFVQSRVDPNVFAMFA